MAKIRKYPKLKKVLFIIYVVLGVSAMILLAYHNRNSFIETTNRFKEVFKFTEVKCFFELSLDNSNIMFDDIVDSVTTDVVDFYYSIKDSVSLQESFWDSFLNSLNTFSNILCDFLIYFCNIGLNIFLILLIYFKETFNAEKNKIRMTRSAKIFQVICDTIKLIIGNVVKLFKNIFKIIKKYKRFVALNVLLYILSNGLLYKIITEVIIFFVVYVYKLVMLETYVLITIICKWIIVTLFPILKEIPLSVYIPAIIILLFFRAISKAEYRLDKNHQRLKKFVKEEITQTTFINGPPGVGKTLLNVSLSLASEEMYIETLERIMLEHEIKYPTINFAYMRKNPDITIYPDHKEYIEALTYLNTRKSYIISNYAIYSPYFQEYSKIFNFDFMRKNKKSEVYALEEYNVISISELDKEYNSHDDMKRVGKDGAATFFSTVSHDLKRHVKVFCDYQLKDQVPLRIRANSEYFFNITERKKKYPFLLGIYYLPIKGLAKLFRKLILKYETKRPTINKRTKRRTLSKYKRNDVSLLYLILRKCAYVVNKICDWFDHYWYFKIKGKLSIQDGEKGMDKTLDINICDLSIENMALYDSTFLSYAYEQKKNKAFKNLEKFTSLTPSIDELTKCNSHFYNKLNGISSPEMDELLEEMDEEDDEIIIINN